MQILITHGSLATTRVLHFRRWQILVGAAALVVALLAVSGAVYHFVFLKAAQERWPLVSQLVRWVVREDLDSQERYLRENLEAMAQRVGELQARLVALQVMGERVAAMAGIAPEELLPEQPGAAPAASPPAVRPAVPTSRAGSASVGTGGDAAVPAAPNAAGSSAPGTARGAAVPVALAPGAQGGPFRSMAPAVAPAATLGDLDRALSRLDERAALSADVFTYVESRLLQGRLQSLLVPSIAPVEGSVGSGFGFRIDPFNGRQALHTGLDYPAPEGTPMAAAAGGVVVSTDTHPEYGLLLVIDHGNGLATRYAHTSRILVAPGDIVRREQVVAEVGSSGRSTGPHLHFEVLVDGVPQNPARFLARAAAPQAGQARVIN